jgi:hypothetical protein
VLEHRIGEDPVEAGIRLRYLARGCGVDALIDPEALCEAHLLGVEVDADDSARAGQLEDERGEQAVAAAEVQPEARGQRKRGQMADLVGPPERGGGLIGISPEEPWEERLG